MGKTAIEWVRGADGSQGYSWNPIRGCSRVSPGCVHCYAEVVAGRFCGPGQAYEGLVRLVGKKRQWNGKVKVVHEHMGDPLRWTKPKMVFVNSMSDLFHENLDFNVIAAIYGIMALSPLHTFQVLTKRPERAAAFFEWLGAMRGHDQIAGLPYKTDCDPLTGCIIQADRALQDETKNVRKAFLTNYQGTLSWPPKNVWLGVSIENQPTAEDRVPKLLRLPAAVYFVSAEPLLGPIDLGWVWPTCTQPTKADHDKHCDGGLFCDERALNWVIVGGESGPNARPMHPDWVRGIRDQCEAAGVPWFFKQWGTWSPDNYEGEDQIVQSHMEDVPPYCMVKVGKKAAGKLLDGQTHCHFPEAA